ncbi:intein-containing Rv2578c family radical SAM protein, partial [Amycolatopsis sp. H20-H5]|uniref:intein-containing Rv2578c family radical SAM protein n=1 Tax=Amycolatopsis sp. H20-H5 TaxID=3046309 RepID=UPI002DB9CD97
MRWDGQRADRADQALPGLDGLVRSVRPPDFDGVTFHEVHAKSVLNKIPDGSGVPFGWTVNPYRGCSHACTYCMEGETAILTADGRTRPLADLAPGDEIYGTKGYGAGRKLVRTTVLAHWSTLKPAYRVTLEDGTTLVASGEHRFLTARGWKHVTGSKWGTAQRPHLAEGTELVGVGLPAKTAEDTFGYRAGYLCGMLRSGGFATEREATGRAVRYLPDFGASTGFVKVPPTPDAHWQRGFLAGTFDLAGTHRRGSLTFAHEEEEIVETLCAALEAFGFRYETSENERRPRVRAVRVLGGAAEHLRFFQLTDPAVTRKRTLDGMAFGTARLRVTSVAALGLELPLFDITTGTGDFIANGMVSHNCFARNTHTYLDFDAGKDFDTQVVVKINAPEVLAAQLRKPGWRREHVAMGTNTDPYQRAEGRYRLMPRIITALARSGTPLSILTKGTVLSRDLPLLEKVAEDVPVGLAVSIALLDRELQRRLEPGTPSPQARLELVRKGRAAGLPVAVLVAPILPGLTDSVEALDALFAELAEAGASSVSAIPLHLRPGAREWFASWLGREHPGLVPLYRRIYGRGTYASKEYRVRLAERVAVLLRRNGLAPKTGYDPRASTPAPA